MTERNYYEVLQLNNSADLEAIHAGYKRLSKEYQHNEFTLFDYILKMQELNKAYLTLADDDTRADYDEGLESESDSESEEENEEVPFEIDEESAKRNNVKVESCNLYLDSAGDIAAIGEIVSTNKEPIENYLEMRFNAYNADKKLIGTGNTFGSKNGNRMTFDNYVLIKSKSAIPVNVKIFFC